jgi:hypothetical protein
MFGSNAKLAIDTAVPPPPPPSLPPPLEPPELPESFLLHALAARVSTDIRATETRILRRIPSPSFLCLE